MAVRFVPLCTTLQETLLHTVWRYVTLRVLWLRRQALFEMEWDGAHAGACYIILVLLVVMSTDCETLGTVCPTKRTVKCWKWHWTFRECSWLFCSSLCGERRNDRCEYSLRIFATAGDMFVGPEDVSRWKFEEVNVARRVKHLSTRVWTSIINRLAFRGLLKRLRPFHWV
jgi:hypothetical protein